MLDKAGKYFPYLLIGLLLGLFFWAIFWPKTTIEQTVNKTIEEQRARSDLAFKNIALQEIVKGKKYWEITAKTAWMNKDLGTALLGSIEGDFLQNGRSVLHFIAPSANWNLTEQIIDLTSPRGFSPKKKDKPWLITDSLEWKVSNNTIVSQGKVEINQDQFTLKGNNLEADLSLKKVRIHDKPTALIFPGGSRLSTIEADLFEYDSNLGSFNAIGSVKAHYVDPALSGKSIIIYSDNANYDPNHKFLQFNNSVSIYSSDFTASAESATFTSSNEMLRLERNASVSYKNNMVAGAAIVVNLKNRKMALLGKTKIKIVEENLVL